MEKIIDVSALIDQLKILLWDRSKSREELAELVIGLIEEAGEEVVRCKDCNYEKSAKVNAKGFLICPASGMEITEHDFCSYRERRDSK